MKRLSFPSSFDTFDSLRKAYSEKHRAYHTLDHIDACLRHLDSVWDQADHAEEIELAIWFHDAIYKPFSTTNEEDSAERVRRFMIRSGANEKCVSRVYNLIVLTKEHVAPETNDAKLMLDIDLSILGATSDVYCQFEKDVRHEYKWVPSFIFKKKRKEILTTFLQRSKIYQMPYFFEKLEVQARENIKAAIKAL